MVMYKIDKIGGTGGGGGSKNHKLIIWGQLQKSTNNLQVDIHEHLKIL